MWLEGSFDSEWELIRWHFRDYQVWRWLLQINLSSTADHFIHLLVDPVLDYFFYYSFVFWFLCLCWSSLRLYTTEIYDFFCGFWYLLTLRMFINKIVCLVVRPLLSMTVIKLMPLEKDNKRTTSIGDGLHWLVWENTNPWIWINGYQSLAFALTLAVSLVTHVSHGLVLLEEKTTHCGSNTVRRLLVCIVLKNSCSLPFCLQGPDWTMGLIYKLIIIIFTWDFFFYLFFKPKIFTYKFNIMKQRFES